MDQQCTFQVVQGFDMFDHKLQGPNLELSILEGPETQVSLKWKNMIFFKKKIQLDKLLTINPLRFIIGCENFLL